ncbi:hypothetical protein NDU88_004834 [Pleurodeles waltl]|uniref:Uncharacterized protein n=1 Tax=Pleurodeles waltl TaxID=8319 RepID=A0AAV7UHU1_PLEWA|nr:hypothetical protein NDU88_004834 [Pleurodeles waltl]
MEYFYHILANLQQRANVRPYGGHSDRGGRRSPPAKRFPPKDRGGHSGFPTGLAGNRQKSARQPSGKHPSHEDAGSEWSQPSGKVRRVQLHPWRISVSAKQTLKFFVGPSYGGPAAPPTAILFLAEDPPGTGWR